MEANVAFYLVETLISVSVQRPINREGIANVATTTKQIVIISVAATFLWIMAMIQ